MTNHVNLRPVGGRLILRAADGVEIPYTNHPHRARAAATAILNYFLIAATELLIRDLVAVVEQVVISGTGRDISYDDVRALPNGGVVLGLDRQAETPPPQGGAGEGSPEPVIGDEDPPPPALGDRYSGSVTVADPGPKVVGEGPGSEPEAPLESPTEINHDETLG